VNGCYGELQGVLEPHIYLHGPSKSFRCILGNRAGEMIGVTVSFRSGNPHHSFNEFACSLASRSRLKILHNGNILLWGILSPCGEHSSRERRRQTSSFSALCTRVRVATVTRLCSHGARCSANHFDARPEQRTSSMVYC